MPYKTKAYSLFTILSIFLYCLFPVVTNAQCNSGNEASFSISNSYGCDSLTVEITNTSSLNLDQVSYFEWDFGNGDQISGDALLNSEFYNGISNTRKFSYTYYNNGTFDISLLVVDDSSCRDSFKISAAVTNISPDVKLEHTINYNEAIFSLENGPPAKLDSWFWNFGDPASGTENYNQDAFEVSHKYVPGAYLISLHLRIDYCSFKILDTIQIHGPLALIEAPFNRIAYEEKYQCSSDDSIHFTNNSQFYKNDSDPNNDDSLLMVNGQSLILFNYNESTGSGDQSQILPLNVEDRRTDDYVLRVWDFGDVYAPQCTTSTANNINVGLNCNFSTDEQPTHKYLSWDSIYHYNSYIINDSFERPRFNDSLNVCFTEYIDTSYGELHRAVFDWYSVQPYTARLYLKDTVNGNESLDEVKIVIGKPNAKKLTINSDIFCPLNVGDPSNVIEFDLNTGGQSYFAVNFDSLSNPSGFEPFNAGNVLAPPSPGSSFPFVLPYELSGNYPDQFVKAYTPSEIGAINYRDPEGSFTLGLIVGNGPIEAGQNTPSCLDTAWYHDMFRIAPMDAEFEILNESGPVQEICIGESAYYKMNTEKQIDIEVLRWNWGYQGIGEGPIVETYFETFHYLEPYTGPVNGRNDENVTYNGEDWKYNYVVRNFLNDKDGLIVLDTIVTSIIKEWITEPPRIDYSKLEVEDPLKYPPGFIEPQEFAKMIGSCIDTSGLSLPIISEEREYRTNRGTPSFMRGNRRYIYTDSSKNDSIEVAYVLHFRDSSLRGYDTLFTDNDTVIGVWKKSYNYVENGELKQSKGPLNPSLMLLNRSGCQQQFDKFLNIGFYNKFWLDNSIICQGLVVNLQDSLRYWQHGNFEWPDDYPIDPRDLWNSPDRYLYDKEIYEVDWDSSDGLNDWERSINLNHIYDVAGKYVITVHSRDSLQCHDTARLEIEIVDIEPNFTIVDNSINCNYDYLFKDSSRIHSSDSIIRYSWNFGDSRIYSNEIQDYSFPIPGEKQIELEIRTKLGCQESIDKNITLANASSLAPPAFSFSINGQTLTTINQSDNNRRFIWLWGDGAKDTAYNTQHDYAFNYNYDLCLRTVDTSDNCSADSCIEVPIGYCNALFGYLKDSSSTYTIRVIDSSTGPNLNYTWYWGDGDSSTNPKPTHDYDSFGKYLIRLKVQTGNCISIYADSLGMDSLGNLLKKDGFTIVVGKFSSIDNLDAGEALIYPNPAYGHVNIKSSLGVIESVELFNLEGKKLPSSFIELHDKHWLIELHQLSGTYYIEIITDRGALRQKIIVE